LVIGYWSFFVNRYKLKLGVTALHGFILVYKFHFASYGFFRLTKYFIYII